MAFDMMATAQQRFFVQQFKAHVDGRRGFIFVLHFRLGQGRAAIDTPVHRLEALVQMPPIDDPAQRPDDVGFELEVHGQVGPLPVAQHAQPFEVFALAVHLFGRVIATGGTELLMRDTDTSLADFLFDLQLDRQTVTVPAGDIGSIVPGQGPGLDNDVLEDLVNGVTDMNFAVGIGRAVMQHKQRPIFGFGLLAQFFIQAHLVPAL